MNISKISEFIIGKGWKGNGWNNPIEQNLVLIVLTSFSHGKCIRSLQDWKLRFPSPGRWTWIRPWEIFSWFCKFKVPVFYLYCMSKPSGLSLSKKRDFQNQSCFPLHSPSNHEQNHVTRTYQGPYPATGLSRKKRRGFLIRFHILSDYGLEACVLLTINGKSVFHAWSWI